MNNNNFIKLGVDTISKLNIFLFYLIIIWTLTPYLIKNTSQLIVITVFIFWWASTFLQIILTKNVFFSKKPLLPLTIVWMIIVTLYIVVQLPNFSFGNYFYIILYYMPIFFVLFYLKYGDTYIYINILKVSYITLFVNAIINVIILIQNPYAAKEATGSYGLIDYSESNIITDVFIFSYVLTVYGALITIKYSKNEIIKYFAMIYSLIVTIMIIQSTFFIAILSLVLIISTHSILKNGNSILTYITISISTILLLIVFLFRTSVFYTINNVINSLTDNYIVIHRVEALTKVLTEFNLYGTLEARIKDIAISFNSFIDNPLFGKGYLVSSDIYTTGIGMHSHLIDDLARFGAISFVIQIMVYIIFANYISGLLEKKIRRVYKISWIGFIFYALFNPIVYPSVGISLFLILPLTFIILESNDNRKRIQNEAYTNVKYPANY